MEFSKLSSNEQLAVYGSVAVIIGGLVGFGTSGLGILSVIAAIGMLALIFLPRMSPSTTLPGSSGSLLVTLGAIAAVVLIIGLLGWLGSIGFMLANAAVPTLFYLVAVAGGVLMAWAGWQAFQAEGGRFRIGTAAEPGPDGGAPGTEPMNRDPDERPPA